MIHVEDVGRFERGLARQLGLHRAPVVAAVEYVRLTRDRGRSRTPRLAPPDAAADTDRNYVEAVIAERLDRGLRIAIGRRDQAHAMIARQRAQHVESAQ